MTRVARALAGFSLLGFTCAFFALGGGLGADPAAGGKSSGVQHVRSIQPEGIAHPSGIAYSSRAKDFFVLGSERSATDLRRSRLAVSVITPFARRVGVLKLAGLPSDLAAITVDSGTQTLYGIDESGLSLVEGNIATGLPLRSTRRFDLSPLAIRDPRGLALDSTTGTFFVLDGSAGRIFQITPAAGDETAERFTNAAVSILDLSATGGSGFRGLAIDPASEHLFVLDPGTMRLHELTQQGEILSSHDLSGFDLNDPAGMVFAPGLEALSGQSAESHLFIADSGARGRGRLASGGRIVELTIPRPGGMSDDAVEVRAAGGAQRLSALIAGGVQVTASSDDAEENTSGTVNLTSSDLELTHDSTDQVIGMRFNGVAISQGATVTSAYIQFTVDEAQPDVTALTFFGQAIDNAPTFTTASKNISLRARTAASVNWSPVPWSVIDQAGPDQATPDLKSIVQEIVNRGGWVSGNSLAIIVTGTGHRTAKAYDGDPALAPILVIQTSGGGGGNAAPVPIAGSDQTITLPAAASLSGSATDDNLPNPPGSLTYQWSKLSGPGTVSFTNGTSLQASANFSTSGTYVLRLTASDSQLSGTDDVQIIVKAASGPSGSVSIRVAASSDDAEESSSGSMSLTSSDLELVHDSSDQVVGIRFNNVAIPKNASIAHAYIQFVEDETQSETTNLTIKAQAIDNAPTFTSSSANVSSRASTSASASWSPLPWNTVGAAGALEQTPELASVVQEVVNRSGWASGNSMAFVITGTGHRTAVAYDGIASGAPLLVVYYGSYTPGNQAPAVSAGPDQSIALSQTASLAGSVSDDGLPNPPGALTITWTKLSGPGTVTFGDANAASTTARFSVIGSYVLRLQVYDGGLTSSSDVTIAVNSTTTGGGSGNGQIGVYVGYYDTHHSGHTRTKPSPWKGSSGVIFVGKSDTSSGGWDTSGVRIDNLSGSTLSGVVVTVDMGSSHFALWGTNSIPAGGILILAQTSGNNFDGSDTNSAGCYGCNPTLCQTKVSSAKPVIHVTIGGQTTNYTDSNQVLNTKGVDSAGCPYTGDRNDESQAWSRIN